MTRLSPSVLLTPDPEGSLFDADEVKKLILAEREACALLLESHAGIRGISYSHAADLVRSRNEESK